MSQPYTLSGFGGLFTAVGGKAPADGAGKTLNALTGPRLRPRRGYALVSPRPEGDVEVQALAALSGYDDEDEGARELLTVRTIEGRTYPAATPLPFTPGADFVEITDRGTALALPASPLSAFVYGGNAYVVQPGADRSLYRHEIGNPLSWDAIQDSAYVPPAGDPGFSADLLDGQSAPFLPADVAAFAAGSSGDGIGVGNRTFAVDSEGALVVSGTGGSNGGEDADIVTTITFPARDFSRGLGGGSYMAVRVETGEVLTKFQGSQNAIEIQVGGGAFLPVAGGLAPVADFKTIGLGSQTGVTFVFSTAVNLVNVTAIRIRLRAPVADPGNRVAFRVLAPVVGGFGLLQTSAAARPWSGAQPADRPILYGTRVRRISTGLFSPILSESVLGATGPAAPGAPTVPLGSTGSVFSDGLDTPAFPRDLAGTDVKIQFLRQDAAGVFRVLAEAPNAPSQRWWDGRREDQLSGLTIAAEAGYVAPAPAPPFTSRGLVGGLAYKSWVVYLFRGGKANVRHSRVGDALELYEDAIEYDDADDTIPADFSLEGLNAEPIGAVQAGALLVIFADDGVYTQFGDRPRLMTFCTKVPESSGPAGARAFCRFRYGQGGYSAAWMDAAGNVYALATAPRFSGDANAEPIEISRAIRGYAREFLGDDLSGAMLAYDEQDDSLFVVLGTRALVLRPADGVDGPRRWEAYEYAVVEDEYGATAWTEWSVVSTPNQSFGGANWDTSAGPDDVTLVAPGASSQLLTRTGFLAGLIPGGAGIVETEARLTDDPDPSLSVVFTPNLPGLSATLDVTRPDQEAWYLDSNWTTPALPVVFDVPFQIADINTTQTLTYSRTYIGPGSPPASLGFTVTTVVTGGLSGGGTRTGTFDGTDPWGTTHVDVFDGPVSPGGPPNVTTGTRNGSGVVVAPVVGGVATISVPLTLVVTATAGGRAGQLRLTGTAVAAGSGPVVYSGLIEFRARYVFGDGEALGTFDALAFDRGRSFAMRSDGAAAVLERALSGDEIAGPLRDAGRAMPPGLWLSGWKDGARRRISDVSTVRFPVASDVGAVVESDSALFDRTIAGGRTFARFPVTCQGVRLRFGARVLDDSAALDALTFDTIPLSPRRADREL